jgi:hypothetical protein
MQGFTKSFATLYGRQSAARLAGSGPLADEPGATPDNMSHAMNNDIHARSRATGPLGKQGRLTIPRRLALLVVVAMIVSVSAFAVQLLSLRATLFEERENAIRNEVQSAATLVRSIAEEAKLGRITDAEAQERAKAAPRAMRFGKGDYFYA